MNIVAPRQLYDMHRCEIADKW